MFIGQSTRTRSGFACIDYLLVSIIIEEMQVNVESLVTLCFQIKTLMEHVICLGFSCVFRSKYENRTGVCFDWLFTC